MKSVKKYSEHIYYYWNEKKEKIEFMQSAQILTVQAKYSNEIWWSLSVHHKTCFSYKVHS